jgi:hypothetical protein
MANIAKLVSAKITSTAPRRARGRRCCFGDPFDQDVDRFSPAFVALDQNLREFGIGCHRLVQPAHGRVPIPKGAEDLDQAVERRARIRHRHRVRDLRKAALSRDLTEHGFEQSSP